MTIQDADADEFEQEAGPFRIPIKKWRNRREEGYENLAAALTAGFDDTDADDLRPDSLADEEKTA